MISPGDVVDVREPPGKPMGKVAELWKPVEGTNKIMCTACARYCKISEGQVGLCGIRGVHQGKLWLYVYGRVITGHVDPIEKKPVQHYRPGSKIFSIATTGCNWLCHPAGTRITLLDGETKPVEEVRPGDELASLPGLGRPLVPDIVTTVGTRKAAVDRLRLHGLKAPLLATAEHPILTPRGWLPVKDLTKGDLVLFRRRWGAQGGSLGTIEVPRHSWTVHPRQTSHFLRAMRVNRAPPAGFAWTRVRDVVLESERETVYSFECVPFHNYMANDVVTHNCRYCFLPGTLVLTDRGHFPIELIFEEGSPTDSPEVRQVNDLNVVTHKGRWRHVRNAFEHLYSGPVLTVRPFYLPAMECTPDHRVFALTDSAGVREVRASELKVGDYLAIPRLRGSRESVIDAEAFMRSQRISYKHHYRLEVRDGRVRWSIERNNGLPSRIQLNGPFARLLGYYCAEGSVNWHRKRAHSGSVWFSFGSAEEDRMRDVEAILRGDLGLECRRTRQGNRTAVIVSNSALAALLSQMCGNSSASKRVPFIVLESNRPDVTTGFLTGYLNGDGYVTKAKSGQLVLGSSSVSPPLTYGVAMLLLAQGELPRVYHARNGTTYEIEGRTVSRMDDVMLRLFVDEVSLLPEETTWRATANKTVVTPDYVLVPIRSITSRDYVGTVYNIEVEEDHSYTANFIAVANCQNADISQRRKVEGIEVEPQDVVRMTLEQGCQGLAYTYNQPTIFIEFARDIGLLARQAGLINIFVSNGYDTPETVAEMGKFLDCVTVDFKGSGETNFVRKYINIPNADPIFQTLLEMRDKTKIHTEITDLIVPQVGDSLDAARHLSKWVYDNLGPDTPIHFLRFHPDYKMMEFPWTPVETLEKHCAVAKEAGLKYVYIGNVPGHPLEHTYCPGCGAIAVKRYGFDIMGWYLDKDNKCKKCGTKLSIVGRLEKTAKENRFYSVLYHR